MRTQFILTLFIALSLNAFSQITSYPINQTISGPGTLFLDLNSDGTKDFSFEIITLSPGNLAARVMPMASSSILDNSTFGYPDALNFGDAVSGNFSIGIGVLGTFNSAGQFKGAGDKYLGIKIHVAGNDLLGWILLNCNTQRDTLKILSCGFQTTPLTPINAGQTIVTNLNEIEPKHILQIYPNPASTKLNLQVTPFLKNATLSVLNSLGHSVKEVQNINGQDILLSLENTNSGIYFIQLKEGNRTIAIRKIMIEH